jgi:hypothetical protein
MTGEIDPTVEPYQVSIISLAARTPWVAIAQPMLRLAALCFIPQLVHLSER